MKILNSKSTIITISTVIIIAITIAVYLTQTWNIQKTDISISKIVNLVNLKSEKSDIQQGTITIDNPIQKITNLGVSSEIFIEELEKLEKLENYVYKKITITKNDKGLNETTTTEDLIYYFLNYKWKLGDEWYIQDIQNRKYYIPEDIIKIKAGTEFKWEPYKGEDDIEIILIYKKD